MVSITRVSLAQTLPCKQTISCMQFYAIFILNVSDHEILNSQAHMHIRNLGYVHIHTDSICTCRYTMYTCIRSCNTHIVYMYTQPFNYN